MRLHSTNESFLEIKKLIDLVRSDLEPRVLTALKVSEDPSPLQIKERIKALDRKILRLAKQFVTLMVLSVLNCFIVLNWNLQSWSHIELGLLGLFMAGEVILVCKLNTVLGERQLYDFVKGIGAETELAEMFHSSNLAKQYLFLTYDEQQNDWTVLDLEIANALANFKKNANDNRTALRAHPLEAVLATVKQYKKNSLVKRPTLMAESGFNEWLNTESSISSRDLSMLDKDRLFLAFKAGASLYADTGFILNAPCGYTSFHPNTSLDSSEIRKIFEAKPGFKVTTIFTPKVSPCDLTEL